MFVVSPVTKCGTKEFITEEVPFYFLCALDLMFQTFVSFYSTFLVRLIFGSRADYK